jgi:DnaJ like chaperone protein
LIAGKIVAGLLGLVVAGIPGVLFGLVLGHFFDLALASAMGFGGSAVAEVRQLFFNCTFRLMGYIAKCDGQVSEHEIGHTEALFRQLGLDEAQRLKAITCFKEGADRNFSPEDTLQDFLRGTGGHRVLTRTLLMFLIALALADGHLHEAEREALQRIGGLLGFAHDAVDELLRMATAQDHFQQRDSAGTDSSAPSLEDAYAALGVSADAPDPEVKRAYRRLMSQNHPDKLSARGVPEEMLRLATEKSQEIQAAYEMVRKARGGARR